MQIYIKHAAPAINFTIFNCDRHKKKDHTALPSGMVVTYDSLILK